MKTNLNYCIVLSLEQLAYLAGSKNGIDRMKILHRLIEAAVLKGTDYAIKGFSTTLQVGQAILSEVDLSCKLGYDKKTISRVLGKWTGYPPQSDDTFLILSMTPQEDLDNRMKENLPNSKDNKQVEAITEDTSSDTDFSLVGKLPVISDEGEQHSPSSFPLVSVSPQPVAEEEFNEDISADSQI